MTITRFRYTDAFENLDAAIDDTTRRIEELGARAKSATEEERANLQGAIVAGAMYRIRRRGDQGDRSAGRHRVVWTESDDEGTWSVCNCGFAALGVAPDDFTRAEFTSHSGHRNRRHRP